MKALLFAMLVLSLPTFLRAATRSAIEPGTVVPVQLNTSLNSQKSKPGERVVARLMQDVPLGSHKSIPEGAKVIGHIVSITPAKSEVPAEISLRFDMLKFHGRSLPIVASLRAVGSMMDVEAAQIPLMGSDRGTPWAWTTRSLIGGDIAYGEGGPVARGTQVIGRVAPGGGALVPLESQPGSSCAGVNSENHEPQATWVFSSDVCGVYGITGLEITHTGATAPAGEITLTSGKGKVLVRGGSGLLLQIVQAEPE